MPDTPERDKKLGEHAAGGDNMSKLITAINTTGHTVTHSDAVMGSGSKRDRDH
jgi:hypothetical protein